jgi:excisionase family DNA binding protein
MPPLSETPAVPPLFETPAELLPALMDVGAVAADCACSTRHIYRLSDAGRMPAPYRLGALVRWNRAEIKQWIAAGCPAVRSIPSRTRK